MSGYVAELISLIIGRQISPIVNPLLKGFKTSSCNYRSVYDLTKVHDVNLYNPSIQGNSVVIAKANL